VVILKKSFSVSDTWFMFCLIFFLDGSAGLFWFMTVPLLGVKSTGINLILGFCRDVDKIYGLLGYYTASCGNYLPTLSRNVGKQLPHDAA
jgi:hypothetical protein